MNVAIRFMITINHNVRAISRIDTCSFLFSSSIRALSLSASCNIPHVSLSIQYTIHNRPPFVEGNHIFFIWMPGLPTSSEQANISLSVFHDGAKVVLLKVLTLFWDFYYTSRVVGVWIWDRLNIQNLHLS